MVISDNPSVVVAGHLCLDVIPTIRSSERLEPGKLIETGEAQFSTGGAVANTGIALNRLGVPVRLVGATGEDHFGSIIRDALSSHNVDSQIFSIPDAPTSYSIVISPEGLDRSFLHCPGVNNAFDPARVTDELLQDVDLLHFGYPPAMRRVYEDGGKQLANLFRRARDLDVITTLDMCDVAPSSPAASVDWRAYLERVLPHVDCFLPSYEELAFMLDGEAEEPPDRRQLESMAEVCLDFGSAVVMIKLGSDGLFAVAGANRESLERIGEGWEEQSKEAFLEPCFNVDVVGTTGAGDTTIAGFIAGMLRDFSLPKCLRFATATGACCVRERDATGGIPSFEDVRKRMNQDWRKRDTRIS